MSKAEGTALPKALPAAGERACTLAGVPVVETGRAMPTQIPERAADDMPVHMGITDALWRLDTACRMLGMEPPVLEFRTPMEGQRFFAAAGLQGLFKAATALPMVFRDVRGSWWHGVVLGVTVRWPITYEPVPAPPPPPASAPLLHGCERGK